MEDSKNFQFAKFQKFVIGQIKKKSIWRVLKIFTLENSKNVEFEKFEKFAMWQIPKMSQIFQFQKITNFENTKIWKTINIP